jgi:hypothetical protein
VIVSFVFRVEEAFAVDLSGIDVGNDMGEMRTVGDAMEFCRRAVRLAQARQSPGGP